METTAGGNSLPEALFIAFEVLAGRGVPSAELTRGVGQATIRAQIDEYMRMHPPEDVHRFFTKGELEFLAAARMRDVSIVVCRSDLDPGYLTCDTVVDGPRSARCEPPSLLVSREPRSARCEPPSLLISREPRSARCEPPSVLMSVSPTHLHVKRRN